MQFKHDWYQTNDTVVLVIYTKSDLTITLLNSSQLSIAEPQNKSSETCLDLYAEIKNMQITKKSNSIEVKLLKKNANTNWATFSTSSHKECSITTVKAPLDPKINKWDTILKDVTTDMDEKEKAATQDLHTFFRSIYENADEDAKKAMIKSFVS